MSRIKISEISSHFFKFHLIPALLLIICSLMTTVHASTTHANKTGISYQIKGKGFPLILIHAFPTDHRLWAPQIDVLQRHFRVITPDLYGFGQASQTNGEAVSMVEQARGIKKLMDQLHIRKAIIGGESMGGYIALAFLKQYPDSVAGLILSDTRTGEDSPEVKIKREAGAKDVLENGTEKVINDFMPKALSPMASDETRSYLKNILIEQSSTGIASALRGMALRENTSSVLSNTELPILILTGDQDALISPQESQNMHALAKNSELIIIQNAGHLSSLEQPQQWNQAVINMFSVKSE